MLLEDLAESGRVQLLIVLHEHQGEVELGEGELQLLRRLRVLLLDLVASAETISQSALHLRRPDRFLK